MHHDAHTEIRNDANREIYHDTNTEIHHGTNAGNIHNWPYQLHVLKPYVPGISHTDQDGMKVIPLMPEKNTPSPAKW